MSSDERDEPLHSGAVFVALLVAYTASAFTRWATDPGPSELFRLSRFTYELPLALTTTLLLAAVRLAIRRGNAIPIVVLVACVLAPVASLVADLMSWAAVAGHVGSSSETVEPFAEHVSRVLRGQASLWTLSAYAAAAAGAVLAAYGRGWFFEGAALVAPRSIWSVVRLATWPDPLAAGRRSYFLAALTSCSVAAVLIPLLVRLSRRLSGDATR